MADVKLRWPEDYVDRVVIADVLAALKDMPDGVIQTCITSPPYWGLRDYKADGQLGLEKTPEEYVAKMVEVFREVRRVLKDDGTLWLNLGDSYANDKVGNTEIYKNPNVVTNSFHKKRPANLKPKDLVGIPWRVAFALQADGWYLRSDIIWSKPNPMPESVTDRPTKAHEYLFLMSKNAKYYYDADAIKDKAETIPHASGRKDSEQYGVDEGNRKRMLGINSDRAWAQSGFRNKRSVWEIPTAPYPEAHFATFPPALVNPCILAGSKEGDIVLDPFGGSGTTAWRAKEMGRRFVHIDLAYQELAEKRLRQEVLF